MTSASLLPLSPNPQQQRLCQGRYSHELALRISLDGFSSPSSTLAPAFAIEADGRAPLSLHPTKSSAVNPSGDPEITTRGFQHVGKVFQKTGN